jgi:hypothetical protein
MNTDQLGEILAALLKQQKEGQIAALDALRGAPPLSGDEPTAEAAKPKGPVARPKRCQGENCKAKLHLTDFACKCEGWFCSAHRHAESHKCSYDFKAQGAAGLEKALVKVTADRMANRV